jgi:hypothetical protein
MNPEIEQKYTGDTEDRVMNYLRRNHPVHEIRLKGFEKPFKSISIDDKLRPLNSKKYIVNLLFQEIEYSEKFKDVEERVIRRTIKKYIDYLMLD